MKLINTEREAKEGSFAEHVVACLKPGRSVYLGKGGAASGLEPHIRIGGSSE